MDRNEKITKLFEKYVKEEHFSGVGFVKEGKNILFHQAFGYAHHGFAIPNDLDTKFDTASITKVFTAVAILQLADQGLFSLNDRIKDILDIDLSNFSSDITIYHLLTHTSGIGDDADEEAGESYEKIWKNKPNYSIRETADYLDQFADKKPNFLPGKGCRYNNCAYILLGLIIEKRSGQRYQDYVKEAIFDAAGMKNTGFFAMDDTAEKAAEHYVSIEDVSGQVIGYRKNIYSYPPIGSADAGALSTPSDLDLFLRALKNGKLLSEEWTKEMLSPKEIYRKHETLTQQMGYGFQFLQKNDTGEVVYIQKDGENAGVSCVMSDYPNKNLTIIIMANQECNVWDLAHNLADEVF